MISVSIVEDTQIIRERIKRHVSSMSGVELKKTYDNGKSALEGLLDDPTDLVIMDIGLPEMIGTEVVARLVDKGYSGDFLMFTVFDQDEHLFRALQLGAVGYILKEEGPKGVVAAIEEFMRGGAPMSRKIAQRVLGSFREAATSSLSAKLEKLTVKQTKVLELMAEGLINKEIADRLDLTEGSIKQHNNRIYRKLSVNNRVEAIRIYLKSK